jgi:hypothetical protein
MVISRGHGDFKSPDAPPNLVLYDRLYPNLLRRDQMPVVVRQVSKEVVVVHQILGWTR